MTPSIIQLAHTLDNHEHAVCVSDDITHVHQEDLDCNFHLLKQSNSFLTSNNFKIYHRTAKTTNSSLEYNYLKNHYQLSFSLRGPPQNI
mgnify:CR=1 FL=1